MIQEEAVNEDREVSSQGRMHVCFIRIPMHRLSFSLFSFNQFHMLIVGTGRIALP